MVPLVISIYKCIEDEPFLSEHRRAILFESQKKRNKENWSKKRLDNS